MLNTHATTSRNRLLILFGVVIASVIVRIITAEYVDIGGDNSEKWRQVHYLVEGLGYTDWYQQTVRWGILLPLAGLMKVFGLNPVTMYIQPIAYSTLAVLCICLIGERLHSLSLGVVAACAAILFPQMAQTGSQLWPGVFELGYLSLCILLILVWQDKRRHSILIAAAVIFFLGWGCRVSMIYAAPGLALLIWLPSRDFKALFLFFSLLAAFFAIEWGAFWYVTGNPMGRLGVIGNTHLETAGLGLSWAEYLLNFKKLVKLKGLIAIWILCFLSSIMLAFRSDSRWRALALLYMIHVTLLLYMISSLSPLKLAMPVGTRFWGVVAPLGLLLLMKGLFDLKESKPRTAKALIAIVFVAFLVFTVKKIPPVNSVLQLHRDYTLLAPLLEEGRPVIMEYEHWQPNFLEEHIIAFFTGKRGKRTTSEDHVQAAIVRNHHRMVALFVTDLSKHSEYKKAERLTRLDYMVFQFTPDGTDPTTEPAAEIKFGRKLHTAARLPQNAEN